MIVTDERVAGLGLASQVQSALDGIGVAARVAAIPSGEQHKSIESLTGLYQQAMEAGLDRSSAIVGLGGGVVCDIAGVLAATYLRGIHLVLVPTTLLAQIDAAIGGKTAVDFAGAKNQIGAFYPASSVLVDPDLLTTLSDAQLSEGLAESVKIATIRSEELLTWLECLERPRDVLDHPEIVRRSVWEKLQVVHVDPYETGERALLNFGHTIGHGVEAASDYRLSHGGSVSVGMAAEMRVAVERGICDPDLPPRVESLLTRFGLPLTAAGISPDSIVSLVGRDKKRTSAGIRMALPAEAGVGTVVQVSGDEVEAAARYACGGAA
jgi:3-dehydroquinate synthase